MKIEELDTKKIYALGCVYQGKNWASKVIKWGAKQEGYNVLFSHSALAVYTGKEWLAFEIVGKGYQITELSKYINQYQGKIYCGTFKRMTFENPYNITLQAFNNFKRADNNKYSILKAGASFCFTKKFKWLNWVLAIFRHFAKTQQGSFCSEVAFKIMLELVAYNPAVDLTLTEGDFLRSKRKSDNTIDFAKIYPAEMQDIFKMELIK